MPSHCSDRRRLLVAMGGGAALCASGISMAEGVPMPKMPDLYTQVPQIGGEWDVVRLFFSFSCPFSKDWHDAFVKWGRSLPNGMNFLPTPLVTLDDDESYPSALAFYSVLKASPARIMDFMVKSYEGVQERKLDPTDVRTYIMAAANAKVDMKEFGRLMSSQAMSNMVERAGLVRQKYKVAHTPSFGIHGRYVASPEGVAGNPGLMLQLLNALVSKSMIELKKR